MSWLHLHPERSHATILAGLIGAAACATSFADEIPAFKLEFPAVYVWAGLEVYPDVGDHPFTLPLGTSTFWGTAATVSFDGGSAVATGASAHLVALHAGEAAPSTTWEFTVGVEMPAGPFGARERRIRDAVIHPGGPHVDKYMAVTGTFKGTVPGPSLAPLYGFIHGSIGKHTTSDDQTLFQGGARLTPPSGQPDQPDQDYPVGTVLVMADPSASSLTMAVILAGLSALQVSGADIRQGPDGPILWELRGGLSHYDYPYAVAGGLVDQPVPPSVIQAMIAGAAYVSVQTPVHSDGQIGGWIVAIEECVGDIDHDGVVGLTDLARLLASYGCCWGNPCYDPNSDLNQDGCVDLNDLATLLSRFGASC